MLSCQAAIPKIGLARSALPSQRTVVIHGLVVEASGDLDDTNALGSRAPSPNVLVMAWSGAVGDPAFP